MDPARLVADYRAAGVSRVMALVRDATADDQALRRFRDRVVAGGASVGAEAA